MNLDEFLAQSDLDILRYEQRNIGMFELAVAQQDIDGVRACLKRGYSPNSFKFDPHSRAYEVQPLLCATSEIARILLEAGADPNLSKFGFFVINGKCIMNENPDLEYVELLLKHGANPNARDLYGVPLDTVDLPTAYLLERYGADLFADLKPQSAGLIVRARRQTETLVDKIPDLVMRRVFEFLWSPLPSLLDLWIHTSGGAAAQFNVAPRVPAIQRNQ